MLIRRFRKKPVVVEAFQFTAEMRKGPLISGLSWVGSSMNEVRETLEGRMKVSDGDWIIKGSAGEIYPCKPDVFAAVYGPADEPDEAQAKADLWIDRIDIAPHIHPAMAGLLVKYLSASIETCREWTAQVNAAKKGGTE